MTKLYYPALIDMFTLGRVVYMKPGRMVDHYDNMVGHVIGFHINSTHEVTIKVQWATGQEQIIHASNLSFDWY